MRPAGYDRRVRLVALGAAALVLAGCDAGTTAPEVAVTVNLPDRNGSGIFGTAEVTRISAEEVRIVTALEGALGEEPLPGYVVTGGCDGFDPDVAAELEPVTGGKSISEVAVPLSDLTTGSYAIAIGSTEPMQWAACGDIVP